MTRHFESLAPVSGLAIVSRTVRVVLRQVGLFVKALSHRGEIRHLAELDDRVLKDIGLSRSDVDGALAEPFYRNPTLVLVRAQERRWHVQRLGANPARGLRPVVPMVKGRVSA